MLQHVKFIQELRRKKNTSADRTDFTDKDNDKKMRHLI